MFAADLRGLGVGDMLFQNSFVGPGIHGGKPRVVSITIN